ncbi:DUF664 domain-containing protein [Arthrobacter sp. UYEF36]
MRPGASLESDGLNAKTSASTLTLIEAYARHNGHADVLRESVDGSTGE